MCVLVAYRSVGRRVCEGGCQQGGDGGLWKRGEGGWVSTVSTTPVLFAARSVCGVIAGVVGARAVGARMTADLAQRGE